MSRCARHDKKLKRVVRIAIADPCEASSPHGFLGLDQPVVDTIAAWLKANMR